MIDALGSALPRLRVVLAQKRWRLARFQVMGQQQLGLISHDAAAASRAMYERAKVVVTLAFGRYE